MLGTLSRASLATAKYTLENGQRLTGIVTSTHKMTATTTVTVERTMLHNITLKVRSRLRCPADSLAAIPAAQEVPRA